MRDKIKSNYIHPSGEELDQLGIRFKEKRWDDILSKLKDKAKSAVHSLENAAHSLTDKETDLKKNAEIKGQEGVKDVKDLVNGAEHKAEHAKNDLKNGEKDAALKDKNAPKDIINEKEKLGKKEGTTVNGAVEGAMATGTNTADKLNNAINCFFGNCKKGQTNEKEQKNIASADSKNKVDPAKTDSAKTTHCKKAEELKVKGKDNEVNFHKFYKIF